MNFQEAIKDHDFLSLPAEEKRKVLTKIDSDFSGLQSTEQDKVLARIGTGQGMLQTEEQRIKEFGGIKTAPPKWVEPVGKAVETVGLLGGGAIGTSLGPVGAVGGAAGGYAIAKGAYRKGLELAGVTKPTDIKETAIQTGKDILTGGAYEAGGQIGGKVITGTLEKFLSPYGSRVTTEQGKELQRLYKEFDIKPFPSEIIPEQKSLSILESVLGYRPVSGDVMIKEGTKKLDALHSIREQLISKSVPNKDAELIGNMIRREAKDILEKYSQAKGDKLQGMVDNFVNKFGTRGRYQAGEKFVDVMSADRTARQENIKSMYEAITDNLPQKGKDVVALSQETKDVANKLLREETSKLPSLRDKDIISMLRSIGKEPPLPEGVTKEMIQKDPTLKKLVEAKMPKMTWEGLKNSRSDLLEKIRIIHKTQGEATKESRVYSALSDAIDKDMGAYAEKVGGPVWKDFLDARTAVKTMHELYDKDLLRIMNKPVEDVLGKIVRGGEVTLLQQIKSATGESGLIPLRQGFFGEVIKQSTKNGIADPRTIHRIITNPGMEETLKELATPQQISILRNIVQKGLHFSNQPKQMKTVEFLETLAGGTNEGVINHIFRPQNRGSIQLAKKLLSPEKMKEIESLAIEKVLQMSKAGFYLPVTSGGQFAKYNIPLKELLTPEKYQSLTNFIKLGQNMKRVEALAQNASQTGQVLLGSQIASGILGKPDMALKTLGVPYVVSKIYTSDIALKYFTNAIKLPPGSDLAISNFIKAWAIVAEDMDADLAEKKEEIKRR
jgi:hypothetical protein